MNKTAKEILDATIDKYFENVPSNERSDFARKLPVPAYEVAIRAMEEYADQQAKLTAKIVNTTAAVGELLVAELEKTISSLTEERDELSRLISDSPLCDSVVDPMLQRAWEAYTTLCEKAEFKFLLRHVESMAKQVKQVTKERDKAVDLVERCFRAHELPGRLWLDINDFLNSLNAAGSDTGK